MSKLNESKITGDTKSYAWMNANYLTTLESATEQAAKQMNYGTNYQMVIVQAVNVVKKKGTVDLNLPEIEV